MAALVVGVPKEIKDKEGRVSVQPDGVAELGYHGREVVVQAGAGSGSGFSDDEYVAAGARVVGTADEVFAAADLIVKVKEPIPEEYDRFRPGQQLFTYLHLAADRRLTEFLLDRRIDSIAYETVQTTDGHRGRQDGSRVAGDRAGIGHQRGAVVLPVRCVRRPARPGNSEPGTDGGVRGRI